MSPPGPAPVKCTEHDVIPVDPATRVHVFESKLPVPWLPEAKTQLMSPVGVVAPEVLVSVTVAVHRDGCRPRSIGWLERAVAEESRAVALPWRLSPCLWTLQACVLSPS